SLIILFARSRFPIRKAEHKSIGKPAERIASQTFVRRNSAAFCKGVLPHESFLLRSAPASINSFAMAVSLTMCIGVNRLYDTVFTSALWAMSHLAVLSRPYRAA